MLWTELRSAEQRHCVDEWLLRLQTSAETHTVSVCEYAVCMCPKEKPAMFRKVCICAARSHTSSPCADMATCSPERSLNNWTPQCPVPKYSDCQSYARNKISKVLFLKIILNRSVIPFLLFHAACRVCVRMYVYSCQSHLAWVRGRYCENIKSRLL